MGESSQSNKLWKGEGKKEPGPGKEWVLLVWSTITKTEHEKECVPLCERGEKDGNDENEVGVGTYVVSDLMFWD